MNKFIFRTLRADPLSQPFVPERKFVIDPGTAMLAGSVLSGIFGLGSSSSANSTNLEIAKMNAELQRETNAQNYQIFKDNLAWNEDMWNKQNEYNLPVQQVQRLLDAGINPATVFGNGSVTPAGSVGSVNSPNMVAPRLDYRQNPYDFSFVGQAVNAYFQNELMSKDIESKGIDNQAKMIDLQFKVSRLLLDMQEQVGRINKQLSDEKLSDAQRDLLESQKKDLDNRIKFFTDNIEYYNEREKLTNDVMKAQQGNLIADTTLKRVQTDFQNMVMSYYPDMTQAELNVKSAQFTDLVRSAELKVKEGELTSAKAVSQYIQNGIDAFHYGKESLKDKARNSNRATRTFYGSLDMIGETLFGNIKLFNFK